MNLQAPEDDRIGDHALFVAFARLHPVALGVSCGSLAAVVLFLMTAVLLVKGPAWPGEPVGQNLGLIGQYFPGFEVSWPGAFIGLAWAFLVGLVLGVALALAFNGYHTLYLRLLERRFRREGLLGG